MIIGDMKPEHVRRAAQIEKQCFSDPWSEKMIKDHLKSMGSVMICAEEEKILLGYIGCHFILDEGYITNVAVHKDHRQIGIGNMLVLSLILRAKEKDISFLTLEVRENNKKAIDLYSKNGFTVAGRRKSYYQNPTEDALIMTCNLQNTEE